MRACQCLMRFGSHARWPRRWRTPTASASSTATSEPENILLSGGHALVADFGIARVLEVSGGEAISATGVVLGHPAYMSPEQARGTTDLDGRSDIYSLGCVLYEMLAGLPPFTGPTRAAVLARAMADAIPSLRTVCPSVPTAVEQAVVKALAKRPEDRFDGRGLRPRAGMRPGGASRARVTTAPDARIRHAHPTASAYLRRMCPMIAALPPAERPRERSGRWGRPRSPASSCSPSFSGPVPAGGRRSTSPRTSSRSGRDRSAGSPCARGPSCSRPRGSGRERGAAAGGLRDRRPARGGGPAGRTAHPRARGRRATVPDEAARSPGRGVSPSRAGQPEPGAAPGPGHPRPPQQLAGTSAGGLPGGDRRGGRRASSWCTTTPAATPPPRRKTVPSPASWRRRDACWISRCTTT